MSKQLHAQLRDVHRHFQLNLPGPRMLPRQFNPERLDVEVDHSASQPVVKGKGKGRKNSAGTGTGTGPSAPGRAGSTSRASRGGGRGKGRAALAPESYVIPEFEGEEEYERMVAANSTGRGRGRAGPSSTRGRGGRTGQRGAGADKGPAPPPVLPPVAENEDEDDSLGDMGDELDAEFPCSNGDIDLGAGYCPSPPRSPAPSQQTAATGGESPPAVVPLLFPESKKYIRRVVMWNMTEIYYINKETSK